MIIEGSISVKAAIESNKRMIHHVYFKKGKVSKDISYLRGLCKERKIKIKEVEEEELEKLTTGKTSGGILADVSSRKEDEFDSSDIFYLDGIEDPFNLGYCMRTLYAFGVKNIYLSDRDYSNMEAQLLKSSAGAYDKLNIQIIKEEVKTIQSLKKDYHIYGLYRGENSKDIFDTKFKEKCVFIIGGEKRGIASDVLKLCDDFLYISYGSDFRNALNACAALDVVATLYYSQRRK